MPEGKRIILPASGSELSVYLDQEPVEIEYPGEIEKRARFLPDESLTRTMADISVISAENDQGFSVFYRLGYQQGMTPRLSINCKQDSSVLIEWHSTNRESLAFEMNSRIDNPVWFPRNPVPGDDEILLHWLSQTEGYITSFDHFEYGSVPPADPSDILDSHNSVPVEGWVSTRLSFDERIYCLFFYDYQTQAKYLKRLAFFVEKPGFRGSLLTNEELLGKHGWNAHDYSSESLARFFSKADQDGFALNLEEETLRDYCLVNSIISGKPGDYTGENKSIVTLTAESDTYLQHLFLTHESVHGIYFVSPEFREGIDQLWNEYVELHGLWELFLRRNDYDTEDEVLIVNEWAAYLLQQPVGYVKSYLSLRFNRMKALRPGDAEFIEARLPQALILFENAARDIEKLVNERYGIKAGDFSLVRLKKVKQ